MKDRGGVERSVGVFFTPHDEYMPVFKVLLHFRALIGVLLSKLKLLATFFWGDYVGRPRSRADPGISLGPSPRAAGRGATV